jgi:hypothetical protein
MCLSIQDVYRKVKDCPNCGREMFLENKVLLPFLWVEGCYPPGKAARSLRKKYSGS